MCGIIGYIGSKEATPLLIKGLEKLEYRGYDSSGVGVISPKTNKIVLRKTQGKIQKLKDILAHRPLPKGTVGISHTRWATHGVPNHINAHPHFDGSRKFLLVHNGIIENHEALKAQLIKKGHRFLSDTDTEVISHLIQASYKGDFIKAVQKAIAQLKGAFALGIISQDHPDRLIAARIGSPLIIGLGKGENFIASDVPAILDATNRVIYLKDREIAVLQKDKVEVFGFNGKKAMPKIHTIHFSLDAVQKQGYAHFMLKEIHEQPKVLEVLLRAYLKNQQIDLKGLRLNNRELRSIKKIIIVACGTAYHAGLVGKYMLEKLARLPVSIDVSSEFRYRDPILNKNTLIITISQSGETADTLAAVREARSKGAKVIAICNVVGSSLTRESDGVLYTHAGPEIGVASTKAYTAQIAVLSLLALHLSTVRKTITLKQRKALLEQLRRVPRLYEEILKNKGRVSRVAKKNSHHGCFLFLGRNINFPSALEGALKLKEISYIPAEGYAAGEMKHGPIALIDEYRAVVCIAPKSEIYEKMISNIQEIRARKGKIIVIATEGDMAIKDHANYVMYVPSIEHIWTPLLVALPLQLFAYYVAVQLGCDVDQPRNLAKSVTVE